MSAFPSRLSNISRHKHQLILTPHPPHPQYSTEGKIKEPNLAAEAGQGLLSAVTSYARGDMGGVFSSLTKIAKTATGGGGKKAEERSRRTKTSAADCVSLLFLLLPGDVGCGIIRRSGAGTAAEGKFNHLKIDDGD